MDNAEEIRAVISKSLQIPIEKLTNDATLQSLDVPSIQVIELVFDLEEAFGITISIDGKGPDDSLETLFNTVGDVIQGVQGLVDAKAGG
jgi:acyl carrier protein